MAESRRNVFLGRRERSLCLQNTEFVALSVSCGGRPHEHVKRLEQHSLVSRSVFTLPIPEWRMSLSRKRKRWIPARLSLQPDSKLKLRILLAGGAATVQDFDAWPSCRRDADRLPSALMRTARRCHIILSEPVGSFVRTVRRVSIIWLHQAICRSGFRMSISYVPSNPAGLRWDLAFAGEDSSHANSDRHL